MDGYLDPSYTSTAITLTGPSSDDNNANVADISGATTYIMTDRSYLYVFTVVTDSDIQPLDNVSMFFSQNGAYECLTVNVAGTVSGTDDPTIYSKDNCIVATAVYPDHYNIEVAIPLTSGNTSGAKFGYHTYVQNANASGETEHWLMGNYFNDTYTLYIRSNDSAEVPVYRMWPADEGVFYDLTLGTTLAELQATLPTAVTATYADGIALSSEDVLGNGTVVSDGYYTSTVFMGGDVNGNGSVESNDAALIRNGVLFDDLDGLSLEAADLNFNGKVDSNDYIILRKFILGMIDKLPSQYEEEEITPMNVKYWGAVGNGTVDDTAAIQACLDNSRTVYFPAGTYRITSALSVPNNTTIYGVGDKSHIRVLSNSDAFVAKGTFIDTATTATHAENISISNLKITSSTLKSTYAVNTSTINDLTVDHLTVRNLGGVMVGTVYPVDSWDGTVDPPATAGIDTDEDLSNRITVTNCVIDCGAYGETAPSGVVVSYAKDFEVSGCTVTNAWQGIQFWGGDSQKERGGNLDNPWHCLNGVVENNYVDNIGGGGCWGSMSFNVRIDNNEIRNCRDVGVDFEGCDDCTASYNKVYDCYNGNFSTFQYCTGDITFSNNESYLTETALAGGHNQHFFNSNSSQAAARQNVVFDNNYFYGAGQTFVNCQSAMMYFTFINNTCVNTGLDTNANNLRNVTVSGNSFTVDSSFEGSKAFVVRAQQINSASVMQVNNNTMVNNGSSVPTGILVYHDNYNYQGNAKVTGNNVSGFTTNIQLTNASTNTGIYLTVEFADNVGGYATSGRVTLK